MTDEYVIVGRQEVPRSQAVCIDCKQPFKFGKNIFTVEGHREVRISGTCEKCFDSYFIGSDNDEI